MLAARATIAVLLVGLVPGAAGAADSALPGAQVTDPAGDAGPGLTPIGVGFEAYDITAIRLSDSGPDIVGVEIQVVSLSEPPPYGEIGVVFGVGSTHYMAGFTVLLYGGEYYAAGFACPATPDGRVNGSVASDCIGIGNATAGAGIYRVDVPRDFIDASSAGTVLRGPVGWSEAVHLKEEPTTVDRTWEGTDLRLVTGRMEPPPSDAVTENGSAPSTPSVDALSVSTLVAAIVLAVAWYPHRPWRANR